MPFSTFWSTSRPRRSAPMGRVSAFTVAASRYWASFLPASARSAARGSSSALRALPSVPEAWAAALLAASMFSAVSCGCLGPQLRNRVGGA